MKLFLQKNFILILFCILLLLFAYMFLFEKSQRASTSSNTIQVDQNLPSVKIGNTLITLEIASSTLEKAEGLSGREKLEKNSGMLFVFNTKTKPGFWMVDMKIPLDIIWILDNKIVDIKKNANPEPGKSPSELTRYFPTVPINYVLEVNGGFCDKNNIKVGDTVQFSNI